MYKLIQRPFVIALVLTVASTAQAQSFPESFVPAR